jgi:endoribonuclease Dicer
MTDQILRQAVERAHIKWENMSLLILDECHNATKNHPMAMLMGFYKDAIKQGKIPGETLPRVLGLSATIIIGNSDEGKISQEIKEIQERLMSKAITYRDYGEVLK